MCLPCWGEEPGAEQKWGGTGGDADGSKGGVGTCRSLGKWWRQGGEQLLCCGKRGDRGSYWRSKGKVNEKEGYFMFVAVFSCTVR